MVNGQPRIITPFLDALQKLATCPAQEFKTQYWAGRCLEQARGWFDGFNKRRDELIRQHGKPRTEQLRETIEKYSASEDETDKEIVAAAQKELQSLIENPKSESYSVDAAGAEALQRFHDVVEKELATEMEFTMTKKLVVRPYGTARGESYPTIVNGEDSIYLQELIEVPQE